MRGSSAQFPLQMVQAWKPRGLPLRREKANEERSPLHREPREPHGEGRTLAAGVHRGALTSTVPALPGPQRLQNQRLWAGLEEL